MAKKAEEYRKIIVKALKNAGTYSKGVDIQIENLAITLSMRDKAVEEIEQLDGTSYWARTRDGETNKTYPVYKYLDGILEKVTRQMKALGLTTELLAGTDETDPLVDLTKKVAKAGKKKPVVLKPENV